MKTTKTFESMRAWRWVAVLVGSAACSVGFAHHSFAMFDATKLQSQKGIIKEVQWTNPHVWVRLAVQDADKEVVYSYEGAAIAVLKRVGWERDSVKVGDKVTVVGHPYKDGRPGGSIEHLVLESGQNLGTGDAIPGALTVPGVR